MKNYRCIFILSLSLALNGCQRSYRDVDLVGSWQLVTNGNTEIFTFSADHSCTVAFESSKDLRNFGEWTLHGNQLAIILRSSSFSPTIVSNREVARIGKLNASSLILEDRDRDDESRARALKRLR